LRDPVLKGCRKGPPHGLPKRNAGNPSACARHAVWPGPPPRPQRCAAPWPAGGPRPRPAPDPPMAGASRPPGRALACGIPGPAGLQGTVAQRRGKRGAFPNPARRGESTLTAAMAGAIAPATAPR
jgi:hypothetical protein